MKRAASFAQTDNCRTHVIHPLKPVFNEQSTTLILGTMPSPKSREYGFYYMHPQNRFWKVLATVYGEQLQFANNGTPLAENDSSANNRSAIAVNNSPATNRSAAIEERRSLILRHHLALWDVLQSCDISGAGDATIRNPVPNDFSALFAQAPITRVCCTGTTAFNLYTKLCAPATGIDAVLLPSPSPANQGRWPVDKLLVEYKKYL